jgi:hypothetical protein
MSHRRFTVGLALVLAGTSMAHAQTRTWVSGVGDDVNPCSRTAPCKTYAGAISKTAARGEISTLDPGGFGSVTITKGITIDGEGTLGSILGALTNGVIVNAPAGEVVILRNLSINGVTTGTNGIRFLGGGTLIVENVDISGFNRGIDVQHNATSVPGILIVRDSTIFNNSLGIRIDSNLGALPPSVTIENTKISKGTIGFDVLRGAIATISGSTVSDFTGQAIVVEQTSLVNATSNVLSNNGTGIAAFNAGATIRLSNNEIFNNTTGVSVAAGGFGTTFSNNRIFGNATNITGTLTPQSNN